MKPTEKFQKTLNGEQPPVSQTTGSSNTPNPVPPTPQQEHRIVLLSRVKSILVWANGKTSFYFFLLILFTSCTENNITTLAEKNRFVVEYGKKSQQKSGQKIIYLTIDDGPLAGTENLVELANNLQVPLNFFVVGAHIERHPEKFRQIISCRYIDVYNHSYTHAGKSYSDFYRSPLVVISDFTKCKNRFQIPSNIIRLPGRNFGKTGAGKYKYDVSMPKLWRAIFNNCGYSVFGWDIEWHMDRDQNGTLLKSGSEMYHSVKKFFNIYTTAKSVIVLAHDQMFDNVNNVNELRKFVHLSRDDEFHFDFILNYK